MEALLSAIGGGLGGAVGQIGGVLNAPRNLAINALGLPADLFSEQELSNNPLLYAPNMAYQMATDPLTYAGGLFGAAFGKAAKGASPITRAMTSQVDDVGEDAIIRAMQEMPLTKPTMLPTEEDELIDAIRQMSLAPKTQLTPESLAPTIGYKQDVLSRLPGLDELATSGFNPMASLPKRYDDPLAMLDVDRRSSAFRGMMPALPKKTTGPGRNNTMLGEISTSSPEDDALISAMQNSPFADVALPEDSLNITALGVPQPPPAQPSMAPADWVLDYGERLRRAKERAVLAQKIMWPSGATL